MPSIHEFQCNIFYILDANKPVKIIGQPILWRNVFNVLITVIGCIMFRMEMDTGQKHILYSPQLGCSAVYRSSNWSFFSGQDKVRYEGRSPLRIHLTWFVGYFHQLHRQSTCTRCASPYPLLCHTRLMSSLEGKDIFIVIVGEKGRPTIGGSLWANVKAVLIFLWGLIWLQCNPAKIDPVHFTNVVILMCLLYFTLLMFFCSLSPGFIRLWGLVHNEWKRIQ